MTSESTRKRKHNTLTLQQKVEIINKIEAGESSSKLSKLYGIGKSTISDIKKNKDRIIRFMESTENRLESRKTLKKCDNPEMEKALYAWYLQEKSKGTPVNGELLCEKAKFFSLQLNKYHFHASAGWLQKFKKRYNINLSQSATEDMHSTFVEPLVEINEMMRDIKNKDESSLQECEDVKQENAVFIKTEPTDEEDESNEGSEDEEENETTKEKSIVNNISHGEAIKNLETCIQWALENSIHSHFIIMLRQLQSEAIKKDVEELKEKMKKSDEDYVAQKGLSSSENF